MNLKQRNQNRATAEQLRLRCPPTHHCPNCGELGHHGHFIPPSFGDEGFFVCAERTPQPVAGKAVQH